MPTASAAIKTLVQVLDALNTPQLCIHRACLKPRLPNVCDACDCGAYFLPSHEHVVNQLPGLDVQRADRTTGAALPLHVSQHDAAQLRQCMQQNNSETGPWGEVGDRAWGRPHQKKGAAVTVACKNRSN